MVSTTYISAAVIVIVQVLNWLGISVASEELTQALTTLSSIGLGLWIMWKRYVKGDIDLGGIKKS